VDHSHTNYKGLKKMKTSLSRAFKNFEGNSEEYRHYLRDRRAELRGILLSSEGRNCLPLIKMQKAISGRSAAYRNGTIVPTEPTTRLLEEALSLENVSIALKERVKDFLESR